MSYIDFSFVNRPDWDPAWSPNFAGKNQPQIPVGTLERGPFVEGLSKFIPNALGQKALDAVKEKTGIDLNVQYQSNPLQGALGFYAGKQPGEAPNVRTINFTNTTPTLGVLLHEAGHSVDPLQNLNQPIVSSQFNALKTPAERLEYGWNHDSTLPNGPWSRDCRSS